jgi:predicted enzyme related to lactoylglutathione lyase
MTEPEPLSILASDIVPITPDPTFATELRARLARTLRLPEGVVAVSATDEITIDTELVPRPGALPYLAVRDARAAIEFYGAVFDAELIGDPYLMTDGRIGHCELAMGGGTIYLADESPGLGVFAPEPGRFTVSLTIAVADTDATVERVQAAGGSVQREPAEGYGGRMATIIDPSGHRWILTGPSRDSVDAALDLIRVGDAGYISWWTPDADQAARFYSSILGWSFDPESDHRYLRDGELPIGINGGHDSSTLYCCYAVEDVDASVSVVRATGGQADEPTDEPFGRAAMCRDPLGLEFAIYRPAPGSPRPAVNGRAAGDATYLTYEVPDTARTREFYAAVLGWRFEPGRVEDGWSVQDAVPMSGLHGRPGTPVIVPMWLVADVAAAVTRVVAAGGRILAGPEPQPYGISAECEDDQGGRFYLGSL